MVAAVDLVGHSTHSLTLRSSATTSSSKRLVGNSCQLEVVVETL